MKPNVVLINCDDLGYGDLGCYGSVKNDTPHIDKLAENGRLFTDFYMASPVCTPSRGALMTGCYPTRIGFGSFNGKLVLFPCDELGLNPEEKTIASVLKCAGYKTMHIGKWHCGDQQEFLPTNHGFDDYYGLPYSNDLGMTEARNDYPPLPLMEGNEVIQQQPDQTSITERYTEKSIEFIRKNKDKPFFLYLAHMHVHLPLYAPQCFVQRSRNGDYGACVMAIDWSTGAIVHALKECGILDNTIIIFTSDNGSRNDFGESNGILRGGKMETWEGGQRVPFIVHWNGTIKPSKNNGIITCMDLYKSLAQICGGCIPDDRIIDGMDLSDLILGNTEKSDRNTFYYYLGNTLEAVRVGDYKIRVSKPRITRDEAHKNVEPGKLRTLVVDDNIEAKELYNLKLDPSESNNIYDENPDVAAQMMLEADKARRNLGDAFTNIKGKDIRPCGKVNNPEPLTEYDESHPYIIALYDRVEMG